MKLRKAGAVEASSKIDSNVTLKIVRKPSLWKIITRNPGQSVYYDTTMYTKLYLVFSEFPLKKRDTAATLTPAPRPRRRKEYRS